MTMIEGGKLYHATYADLLPSIEVDGLISNAPVRNWSFSRSVVCLAEDPLVAESYAETSEYYEGAEHEPDIVILEIDFGALDLEKLFPDDNVDDAINNGCLEYHGMIPWEHIKFYKG